MPSRMCSAPMRLSLCASASRSESSNTFLESFSNRERGNPNRLLREVSTPSGTGVSSSTPSPKDCSRLSRTASRSMPIDLSISASSSKLFELPSFEPAPAWRITSSVTPDSVSTSVAMPRSEVSSAVNSSIGVTGPEPATASTTTPRACAENLSNMAITCPSRAVNAASIPTARTRISCGRLDG